MNKEEVLNFLKNKNNLMIIGVIILGIIFMTAFGTDEKPKKRGYIVVSADKGLAGAYNHNIVKLTEECLKQEGENLLFIVGELGRVYFTQHDIPIYKEFHYAVQDPNLTRARDISDCVVSLYDAGELDEIYIIYTHAVNSMQVEAKVNRLLPLKKKALAAVDVSDVYAEYIRMVPTPIDVLENVVPSCVAGYVYGALVESFCCEQNSRMMAMQAATDNAKKMLKELQAKRSGVFASFSSTQLTVF